MFNELFMDAAIEEARQGYKEGGIPIGAVLVHDNKIIGRGHNQRVQKSSAILHAEMDAIENAGRLPAKVYQECSLYTTLSPCPMCSGTIILYNIPNIFIGENKTFNGEEILLSSKGINIEVVNNPECIKLMEEFTKLHPNLWNEDIGY